MPVDYILATFAGTLPATMITWLASYILYKKIYKRRIATLTVFLSFVFAWIAIFIITFINSENAAYTLGLGYAAVVSIISVFLWALIDEKFKWHEAQSRHK